MTVDPEIHDWRRSIVPSAQLVMAGGAATSGGLTLGGALVSYRQPGGRTMLMLEFATQKRVNNTDASWTYSRVMARAIMRIPIRRSDQLVPASDLDGAEMLTGIPWASAQPWATGENWAWAPFVRALDAAPRGAATFTVGMAPVGRVLKIGHVVGFTFGAIDSAHVVMDIEYDDLDRATVTVEPTLRRPLVVGEKMLFRPSIVATCQNPEGLAGTFAYGRFTRPGAVRFVEALL